jgi:hypothetical protein
MPSRNHIRKGGDCICMPLVQYAFLHLRVLINEASSALVGLLDMIKRCSETHLVVY